MLDINWTLPVALVSVIVFLVLMNKILFKPLIQFMDARDKGIRDNLDEATRLLREAESALTGYESAIDTARRDMAEQPARWWRRRRQRSHARRRRRAPASLTQPVNWRDWWW